MKTKIVGKLGGASGFTLITMLVVVALFGILSLASLALIANMHRFIMAGEENHDLVNQLYIARKSLETGKTCQLNFAGIDLSTGTVALSKQKYPKFANSTGNALSSSTIFPTQKTTGAKLFASQISLVKTSSNLAELKIEFSRRSGGSSSVRNLPMSVQLDAQGAIVDCSTGDLNGGGSGSTADRCQNIGLTITPTLGQPPPPPNQATYAEGTYGTQGDVGSCISNFLCVSALWVPLSTHCQSQSN